MSELSEIDLISSWLSFKELHGRYGMVILNPCDAATSALTKYDVPIFRKLMKRKLSGSWPLYDYVVQNPRAFWVAYECGMDFLSKDTGHCINPAHFPALLTELVGNKTIFSLSEKEKAIELLRGTIQLENAPYYKVRPFLLSSVFGFLTTEYMICGGEVGVNKSFLGVKFGDRPSVPISHITKIHANGTLCGDIVFGDGSEQPVIWKKVLKPESVLRKVKSILKKQ